MLASCILIPKKTLTFILINREGSPFRKDTTLIQPAAYSAAPTTPSMPRYSRGGFPVCASLNPEIVSATPPSGVQNLASARVDRSPEFFHSRLDSLGIPYYQARHHGLKVAADGSILQVVRTFTGQPRYFIPEAKKKQWQKISQRKGTYALHDSQFYRELCVRRLHPAALAANPRLHKYMNEKGQRVYPLPGNLAIANYGNGEQGGTVTFIEGYFKALALDLGGLETVAFTGISVYRLSDALTEYLTARRPERINILYDADALQLGRSSGTLTSRRSEDFFHSVDRFSGELFALCRRIQLQCDIFFIMGRADSNEKGVDDMIEVHGQAAVIDDLASFPNDYRFQTTEFFSGFKLAESTRRAKLKKLFLGRNYREWAEAAVDKDFGQLAVGFKYCKANYRAIDAGNLMDATITYALEKDPFAVEVTADQLEVRKYLDEQRAGLDELIDTHKRLAVQAPTGAGKTTFFIEYAKRKDVRMVLAVPTVNLVKQVARQYKVYGLHGNYRIHNVQLANEAPIVVCTYDTLCHVPDLWRRVLVIDEAHNLINQYGETYRSIRPFRAETLRKCTHLIEEAARTILLSGTMPDLLCRALEFSRVDVTRSANPSVRVFDIEANHSSAEGLSKCLLAQLVELDWSTPLLQVVFWNHTDQIEQLRNTLLDMKLLQPDEIAVITRRHYNDGHTEGLNEIIRYQKVAPGIKLLLCTCLISEGVNIKNTNVSRIYTVGLRCPDTFRQFIARFRKLETVNVFSILEAERDLQPEFFFPAELELAERFEAATLQAKHLQRRLRHWESDYDTDELPFLDEIQRQIDYRHESKLMRLVYRDGKEWRADVLHVLSHLRGRMLATGNNCYFYTTLRRIGFHVLRVEQVVLSEAVEEAVDVAHAAKQVVQKDFLEGLREELQSPDLFTPVNALYFHYREQGNRHAMARLRHLADDLIEEEDASTLAWLATHRRHLDRDARDLIMRSVVLRYFGIHDRAEYLALSKTAWRRQLRQWTFHFENEAFAQRSNRKKMLPEHKEEIRIKRRMAELIDQHAGEEMTPEELQQLISVMNWRKPDTGKVVDVMALSPAQVLNIALEVSATTTIGHGRSRSVILGRKWSVDYLPAGAVACRKLVANPLLILAFTG